MTEFIVDAYDDLALSDDCSSFTVHNPSAGDDLDLTHGAICHNPRVSAGNALAVYDLVFNPETFVFDYVIMSGLRDGASCIKISNLVVGDILSFQQGAFRVVLHADAIAGDAGDSLTLTDGAVVNIVAEAGNTITLTQGATAQSGRAVGNSITLSDGATVDVVRTREAGNTLTLGQGVAYTLIRNSTECFYSPFVGRSTTGPTPPSTTLPVAYGTLGFRLQWPATGTVTDELILKFPNLGNAQRITKSRIARETRGGTLIVYSDPTWPKFDSLVLTISAMKSSEKQALLTFIDTHLGQTIRLIDWENREWKGLILPGDMFTEDRRESFTASFEFEGQRVLS